MVTGVAAAVLVVAALVVVELVVVELVVVVVCGRVAAAVARRRWEAPELDTAVLVALAAAESVRTSATVVVRTPPACDDPMLPRPYTVPHIRAKRMSASAPTRRRRTLVRRRRARSTRAASAARCVRPASPARGSGCGVTPVVIRASLSGRARQSMSGGWE